MATDSFRARRGRLAQTLEAASATLWPVPVAITAAAVAAGLALPHLDDTADRHLPDAVRSVLFGGGADEARQLLSAIATGLITTVSLVFSLTVVVFQLASSQYSPRLLRVFPRDSRVRITLGVLVGSFCYALAVLRNVRSGAVPRIAVTGAFLLTVAAAILLIAFLGHLVRELRVETMLKRVHAEQNRIEDGLLDGMDGTDENFAPTVPEEIPEHRVGALKSGFLVAVDGQHLLEVAVRHGVHVRVLRVVGAAITQGTPIVAWRPLSVTTAAEIDVEAVTQGMCGAIVIGYERTATQDLGYGIQQLVDIYVKALSPGINDPTTAVSSISHLGAVLAGLADRNLAPRRLGDRDGIERVRVPVPDYPTLLEVAFGPVRTYGNSDVVVLSRVAEVLRDLAWVVRTDEQREAVEEQLQRLECAADRGLADAFDRDRLHARAEQAREASAGRWAAQESWSSWS